MQMAWVLFLVQSPEAGMKLLMLGPGRIHSPEIDNSNGRAAARLHEKHSRDYRCKRQ